MNNLRNSSKWLKEISAKIHQGLWDTPQEMSEAFHQMINMFLPLKRYGFFQKQVLFANPSGALHLYFSRKFACKMEAYLDIERFGDLVTVHFNYGRSYAINEKGECIRARDCRCWVDSRFISYYLAGVLPKRPESCNLYWKQLKQKTLARYPYIDESEPAFFIALESTRWKEAGEAWFEIFVNESKWKDFRQYIRDYYAYRQVDVQGKPFPWELC